MLIKVTKTDIKNGIKGSMKSCPIALAIKKKIDCKDIIVSCKSVDWRNKKDTFNYTPLPEEVIQFIRKFDAGEKVEPFQFEIGIK